MDARAVATAVTIEGSGSLRPLAMARFARTWMSVLSLCSGFLLLAFALLLLVRRFDGGLKIPLTSVELVGVGALLAFLAAVVHRGAMVRWRGKPVWIWVFQLLLLVGLVASAIAVALPGSSLYGIWAMVALLTVEEGYWLRRVVRQHRGRGQKSWHPLYAGPKRIAIKREPAVSLESSSLPEGVRHRIERTCDEQEGDICRGQVRSHFQLGQRTESIHLAFCPPFAVTPQLHAEQIDGPDATLKTMQILPYGARLEIRLSKTYTQPVQTMVEFSAISD